MIGNFFSSLEFQPVISQTHAPITPNFSFSRPSREIVGDYVNK